ncbi:DUF6520 family protein [Flagellimonas aurea]|uniref:DUF6520 family protein n=1 Tax=Flagellimonas aurea TaxID=2915619 RepID=UPI0035D0E17B
MKSKFLKLVLPAFAILMAVGLAFATEDRPVPKIGYYEHPTLGWQEVTVDDNCGESGSIACTAFDQQVYSEPDDESTPLMRDQ